MLDIPRVNQNVTNRVNNPVNSVARQPTETTDAPKPDTGGWLSGLKQLAQKISDVAKSLAAKQSETATRGWSGQDGFDAGSSPQPQYNDLVYRPGRDHVQTIQIGTRGGQTSPDGDPNQGFTI